MTRLNDNYCQNVVTKTTNIRILVKEIFDLSVFTWFTRLFINSWLMGWLGLFFGVGRVTFIGFCFFYSWRIKILRNNMPCELNLNMWNSRGYISWLLFFSFGWAEIFSAIPHINLTAFWGGQGSFLDEALATILSILIVFFLMFYFFFYKSHHHNLMSINKTDWKEILKKKKLNY